VYRLTPVCPIGATSLKKPPMYCGWLNMLMKRAENCNFLLSVMLKLLAMVISTSSMGLKLPGIPAAVGQRARAGLDVAGVRVVGQVSHGVARTVRQRRHTGSRLAARSG
jgi:hypothetical protein